MSEPLTPESMALIFQLREDKDPGVRDACRTVERALPRIEAAARASASTPDPALDGFAQLVTDILRKYGGTMKGRGDHDIFDALVRYRDVARAARDAANG